MSVTESVVVLANYVTSRNTCETESAHSFTRPGKVSTVILNINRLYSVDSLEYSVQSINYYWFALILICLLPDPDTTSALQEIKSRLTSAATDGF